MALKLIIKIICLSLLVIKFGGCGVQKAEAASNKAHKVQAACTKNDIKLAINNKNQDFPQILDTCASKAWGKALKTGNCLKERYPTLSVPCTSCFGKMVECSASHCKLPCLMNHFSDKCLACVDSNCRSTRPDSAFSLIECTGLKAHKLPPQK